jgi:alkylation response protein AidB-like acyl-CoA dehydrogenase
MMNHATTELFFDQLRVPTENLIGEEGRGFHYIMDGMNAERILIASECIGDARWFIDKASAYASGREVFGRPIGQNQGVQFPIARAHIQTEAAALMVRHAADRFDAGQRPGSEANMAKLLASEAAWAAADTCITTHGGYVLHPFGCNHQSSTAAKALCPVCVVRTKSPVNFVKIKTGLARQVVLSSKRPLCHQAPYN